ncbi:MAG: hypothetical protein KDE26_20305, partial [Bacteroidetes bacterium]|nr:hypothetical protein [Bacteroidota bacterium]
QEEGPSEKNMQKIKETQRKELETDLKDNRVWLNSLMRSYQYETDPEAIMNQEEPIEKLKAKHIQKAARKYFDMDNFAKFVLKPETEENNSKTQ